MLELHFAVVSDALYMPHTLAEILARHCIMQQSSVRPLENDVELFRSDYTASTAAIHDSPPLSSRFHGVVADYITRSDFYYSISARSRAGQRYLVSRKNRVLVLPARIILFVPFLSRFRFHIRHSIDR